MGIEDHFVVQTVDVSISKVRKDLSGESRLEVRYVDMLGIGLVTRSDSRA